jgi:uncharacterized repeat protein (TIGR01451 family)
VHLVVEAAGDAVGARVRFVMTVANTSGADACAVLVETTLSDGLEFVEASEVGYDGGTGWWSVGRLEAGGERQVRLTVALRARGRRLLFAQVLRRSGRRREQIDYYGDLVYSPFGDLDGGRVGALYWERAGLPHY